MAKIKTFLLMGILFLINCGYAIKIGNFTAGLAEYNTKMYLNGTYVFDEMKINLTHIRFSNYSSEIIFNTTFTFSGVNISLIEFDLQNDEITVRCEQVEQPNSINFTHKSNKTGYEDVTKTKYNCTAGETVNFLAPTGPAVYEKNINDAINYSELTSSLSEVSKYGTDIIGYYEMSGKLGVFIRGTSSYITINDVYSRLGLYHRNLNETITVAEMIEKLAKLKLSKYDEIALEEYLKKINILKRSFNDSVTAGELIEKIRALELGMHEKITVYEFLVKIGIFEEKVGEEISPYDMLAKLVSLERKGYDKIALSYALYKIGIFDEKVIDAIIYNEIMIRYRIFSRDLTDTITYDEFLRRIGFWKKDLTENITVGEILFKLGLFKRIDRETIKMYETLYKFRLVNKGFYDTMTYGEIAELLKIYTRKLSEPVTIGELLEKLAIVHYQAIETVDFATVSSALSRNIEISRIFYVPISIISALSKILPAPVIERDIAYLFYSGFSLSKYKMKVFIEPPQIIITDTEPETEIIRTVKIINKEDRRVGILVVGVPKVSERLILLYPGEEKELTIKFLSPKECESKKYQLAFFIYKEGGIYVRKNLDISVSSRCMEKIMREVESMATYHKKTVLILLSILAVMILVIVFKDEIVKELKSFLFVNRKSK